MNKLESISVVVKQEVSLRRIGDLLAGAFEGGSNYWYLIDEWIEPTELWSYDEGLESNGVNREPDVFKHIQYPLSPGGAVIVSAKEEDYTDKDGKTQWRLDLVSIKVGLQVFADKYPKHYGDFINDNDDGDTADCFLQCALFGEMIYG